jgi:GntR family transcriptional regulator
VRDRILSEISSGALAPGERLGGERDLAESYGVSRSTLRAALGALESMGAIRRQSGRTGGTFVAARKVERDLRSMAGLPSYLRRQGFSADARVLSTATIEADAETAAALDLAVGALVLEIVRVRLADGEPISYERARFPAARFAGMLDHGLGGSLYELLQSAFDVKPGEAMEQIEIVGAGSAEAKVLEVKRSTPLVAIIRTAWDRDGRPFEHSHDLFRSDRVRIVVRTPAGESAARGVASTIEVVA